MVFARGRGKGNGEMLVIGYKVTVMQDKYILKN